MKLLNRYSHLLLLALIVCGFSLSVTSCKDDDDDKNEQRSADADPLDTDEAHAAWRWLNNLTDAQSLPDNWSKKTFEPTVGVASENNKLTRIVVVGDIDEARRQFADLADVEVSQLDAELTVSHKGVGSLTWTPSKAGAQNLAEVAVNSSLIPNLQKLVYCTSDQVGVNGIFWDNVKGTAWYRFGDVIRDAEGYYWVCVRPSFAPDKGDSHWINVFNATPCGQYNGKTMGIPTANLVTKYNQLDKYDKQIILLPTKLNYKREHIYNLSNLLWAMLKPGEYGTTLNEESKKRGLGGFDGNLNGPKFIQRVAEFWDEQSDGSTLWEKIFHRSREDMEKYLLTDFYYKDYSWIWGNGGYLWRYQSAGYENSIHGSESGDKTSFNFVGEGFDVTYLTGLTGSKEKPNGLDSDRNGAWLVRYKTGAQLCSKGSYSPYERIQGCTDIYRYNQKTGKSVQSDLETENDLNDVPLAAVKVGDFIGQNGKFYRTMDDVKAAKTTAVAIVCHVAPGKKSVEDGSYYHGLAVATEDINANTWLQENNYEHTCLNKQYKTALDAINVLDGIAATNKLLQCQGHNHPFVKCLELAPKFTSTDNKSLNYISNWFVPSLGQFTLALQGMGLKYEKRFEDAVEFSPIQAGKTPQQVVLDFFNGKGTPFIGLNVNEESGWYWLATECSEVTAFLMYFARPYDYVDEGKRDVGAGGIWTDTYDKVYAAENSCMRPFLAFGYKGVK